MVGICHMQVCAEEAATDEEILAVCNRENPSGTSMGWSSVVRVKDAMADGPTPCADDPTRIHLLVRC